MVETPPTESGKPVKDHGKVLLQWNVSTDATLPVERYCAILQEKVKGKEVVGARTHFNPPDRSISMKKDRPSGRSFFNCVEVVGLNPRPNVFQ